MRENEAKRGSKEKGKQRRGSYKREQRKMAKREDEAKRGSKEKDKQRRQTAAYNDTGVLSVFFYLSSMVSPP